MNFYNRERELDFLRDKYGSGESELVVIYGRRRVGKTELLTEFLKDKEDGIYHLVSRESEKDQLSEFKQTVSDIIPDIDRLKDDWNVLLKEVSSRCRALVIDEFQYMIETNNEILRRLQKVWDQHLSEKDFMLVLTGSSVGMMENEVLGYKSPIYGRRTGQWNLKPFKYWHIKPMFPDYSFEDVLRTYAVLGGTPYYLTHFDSGKTLLENIQTNILSEGTVLREEAPSLLQQELRKPKNYFSILKAIARGKNRFNEIQNTTGIGKNSISKYLQVLRRLRIVRKELPVTASEKSKRGLYRITDNYFNFWFRYILPNKTMLEQNTREVLDSKIKPELDWYVSKNFEDICVDFLKKRGDYNKIGSWWYNGHEIDVAALNEREDILLLGECKWKESEVEVRTLEKLEEKSEKVQWRDEDRKEVFALFSRSGFADQLEEVAENREDVELYGLEDLNI